VPTILLTNSYEADVLEFVMSQVPEGFDLISLSSMNKEELIEKAPVADYFIVSGRLPIDKEVIDAAKKLKMIQRTGVGVEQIDLDVLRVRSIPLYVNRGVNAQAVAEHTLLLMLAVYRKLLAANSLLKDGVWEKQSFGIQTRSLFKKTIGLIGLGNIGLELVKLLQPFDVNILYHKRTQLNSEIENTYGLRYVSKQGVIENSDVISLMCAYSPETHEIIDASVLENIKPDAIIINTSRGRLINEDALVNALKLNKLAGAALDVHYNEPLRPDHPLTKFEQVVLTAHTAGITRESFSEIYIRAFRNITSFENGNLQEIKDKKVINE